MKEDIPKVLITKETPVSTIMKFGRQCSMDGKCCEYGGGFVIKEDIPRIAKVLGIGENQFKAAYLDPIIRFNTPGFKLKSKKTAKPYGPCVFHDSQKCRIHDVKPLHCKVGTCGEYGEHISHWFTLNYYVNPDDPQSLREWEAYIKTHETIPGGEVESLVPDKEALKKIRSYEKLK
jgi:Fe-S-cluster containining protein